MDNIHGHFNKCGLLHKIKKTEEPRQTIPPLVFLEKKQTISATTTAPAVAPTPRQSAVIIEKAQKYPSAVIARTAQARRPSITSKPELSISPEDTEEAVQPPLPVASV
jgi:hypothetical protein